MRQPPVFDFVPKNGGDKSDKNDPQLVRGRGDDNGAPAFEPTRDGWRAYEAWCKQIREGWDSTD